MMEEKNDRFKFGKNWSHFISVLDDERIKEAEGSLRGMLDVENLENKSFIDIGSGSGLFSLCAARLGASKVHSFDYDAQSVACAGELKKRYFNNSQKWVVEQGSVLDPDYLGKLGQWDVVYSWGVLHHTGNMWKAFSNILTLAKQDSKLYIAIYNKQKMMTPVWTKIKKTYVKKNAAVKFSMLALFMSYFALRGLIMDLVTLRNPIKRYTEYNKQRGMHMYYDWIDWIGGYPFEAAKPEEIIEYFRKKGFVLDRLKTQFGSSGCNEFVFQKK